MTTMSSSMSSKSTPQTMDIPKPTPTPTLTPIMSTDVLLHHLLDYVSDDRTTYNALQRTCREFRKEIVHKHHHHQHQGHGRGHGHHHPSHESSSSSTPAHTPSFSIPWPRMIDLQDAATEMWSTSSSSSSQSQSQSSSYYPEDVRCMAFTDQYFDIHDISSPPDSNDSQQQQPQQPSTIRRCQLLALASYGKIFIYDVQIGLLCVLTEVVGWIKSLQFSHDGRYLACAGNGWLNPVCYYVPSFYSCRSDNNNNDSSSRVNNGIVYITIPLQQATSLGTSAWDGRNASTAGRVHQLGWLDGGYHNSSNSINNKIHSSPNASSQQPYHHHFLWVITQDNTLWKCNVQTQQCTRSLYWGPHRWFCKLLTVVSRPSNSSSSPDDNDHSDTDEKDSYWSIVKFEGCIKLIQCHSGQHAGQMLQSPPSQQQPSQQQQQQPQHQVILLHDNAGSYGLNHFVFSPCRNHIVAGGDHGLVQIWIHVLNSVHQSNNPQSTTTTTTTRTKYRLPGLQSAVKSVTFSPCGQFVAALDSIGIIMIWKMQNLLLHQATATNTNGSSSICNSSSTQSCPTTLPVSLVRFESTVPSSSGTTPSTGHDGAVDNYNSRQQVTGMVGVHSIAFTPDSAHLVAASTDGRVRFFSRTSWSKNPSSLLYFHCHHSSNNNNNCTTNDNDDDDDNGNGPRRRSSNFASFTVG